MSDKSQKIDFFDNIQAITEALLTHRKKSIRQKKAKRAKKSQIRDWLEAFLWAACMVLLINQYLVQAYRIPSGSMIDTLNIGDQVFVNKLIYGPELLPGVFKLPSPVNPKRNDIIIFENPEYKPRGETAFGGTVFDITQRIIYMLTLSIVDIDRDETGSPRVRFLIKRAAGETGDRVVMDKGNFVFRFAGENRWVSEEEYNMQRGWSHNITRELKSEDYNAIIAYGQAMAWRERQLPVPERIMSVVQQTSGIKSFDSYAAEVGRLSMLRMLAPEVSRYRTEWNRLNLGRYVPKGRVLPLGDNRDNSRDGREFGPVRLSKVLGKGVLIYWPLKNIGRMK